MRPPLLPLFTILFGFAGLTPAAVSYRMDTPEMADLTLVLRNFNTPTDPGATYSNNTGLPRPTFVSAANGAVTYEVAPSTVSDGIPYPSNHDPQINFTTVPFNVLDYNHVRVRQKYTPPADVTLNHAPSSEMWPRSAIHATTVSLGSMSTAWTEHRAVWRNPTEAGITTSTTGGIRWDPIVGGITHQGPLQFDLDYFMVDRGRVVGFEFDLDGTDATQHRLGFSSTNVNTSTLRVEGGALKGVSTNHDAFVMRSGLAIDSSLYKFVEVRLRRDAAAEGDFLDNLQFFWASNVTDNNYNNLSESKSLRLGANDPQLDGEWHTYMLDFSQEASWTGNITTFRVDVGGRADKTFEIDYIRFRELGAVPEPSHSLLIGGAMFALGLRRRRTR